MIYLFLSIIFNSYLTVAFKLCGRFGVQLFQAIVFNYITCIITGSIFNGEFPLNAQSPQQPWFWWSILMGCMFISIFNLVGYTTQKAGIAITSVAFKLSLVIPFLFSVLLYHESASAVKIFGIVLAIIAVVLTSYQKNGGTKEQHNEKKLLILLPLVLFISSGLLDALLNHIQKNFVTAESNNNFLVAGFVCAGTAGISILLWMYARRKMQFRWKHVLAGICIGVPNYFSIWCIIKFLQVSPWQTSASFPVNNMGIVLFSALIAWLVFKEKLSAVNWAGIALAVAAIYLIAFGDNL